MRIATTSVLMIAGALLVTGTVDADTIVQEGSLSGFEGEPGFQEVLVEQFDTQGGTRVLNFVQLDFLTAVIGGGQTTGMGGPPTSIYVALDADYYLDGQLLAQTQALVDTMVHHNGPPTAFSVFDNDFAQVVLDKPEDMAPWIGAAQLTLDAFVQFIVEEDPPGSASFSAGGSVDYTVTYDYDVVSVCPADFDGDGSVGFADLLAILSSWGPCPGCPQDIDGDGSVGFADLLVVLSSWGDCP